MRDQNKNFFVAFAFAILLAAPHAFAADMEQVADSGIPAVDSAQIIQPGNRLTYQLSVKDRDVAAIRLYAHPTGTFLPVKDILQALGVRYSLDENDGVLQIEFPGQAGLSFRFRRGEYIKDGVTHALRGNDFIVDGFDFYLRDASMNDIFPLGFSVNQAGGRIRVVAKEIPLDDLLPPVPPPSAAKDDMPPADAAPRLPVIVDDIQRGEPAPGQDGKKAEPAEDVLRGSEPVKAADSDESSEGDVLVLQPKIKRAAPSNLFIEALEKDDRLFLPFDDMMRLLEFDVKTDVARKTAQGSFIDESHGFALDADQKTVRADGRNFSLDPQRIIVKDDHLYVDAEDFSAWFDIKSTVDRQAMVLVLNTDRELPVELRDIRHNKWSKLLGASLEQNKHYAPRENPYKLASIPFLDVNLNGNYRRDGKGGTESSGDYTIVGAGDLGYLTADSYVAGSSGSGLLDTVRVRAGRNDPAGQLLGPLRATRFSVGDIDSPGLDLMTNNSLGRGFVVTNRAAGSGENFDTRTFNGNAVPGWEAELYRNNVLVAFQNVDANGRYEFRDVPILYGNSVFRIVLYGPQGQSEERVETVNIGDSMLKAGQFEYTASLNEKSASLIDVKQTTSSASGDAGGLRGVGEMRFGVADILTAGIGLAETRLNDGNHHYGSLSASSSLYGLFGEGRIVKDMRGGWAGGATALTSIADTSLRFRHLIFHHFLSETENNPADPRRSETSFDTNTQFYLPIIQDMNFGLEAKRETFTIHSPRNSFSNRLSKSVWGMSLSNTLDFVQNDERQIDGSFGLQTRLYNVILRAVGLYGVQPKPGLTGSTVTAQYRLTDRLGGQTQVDHQLGSESTTRVSQSLNWDFDRFRLSFAGGADDARQVFAGVSLIFSVGHDDVFNRWRMQPDSLHSGGAIAGRVFVDANYNDRYDEGEKLLPDAALRVNQLAYKGGEDGVFIPAVTPYQPANVEVDIATLKDPMLTPANDGYRIITRPGDVVGLDLPVVSTSEIDGNAALLDDTGTRYELPNTVIELQDSEGRMLRRVMSEFDGFYVFDKIRPGEYIVTVPAEVLTEYNAELKEPRRLKIEKTSDFYSGIALDLRSKGPIPAKLRRREAN